MAVLGYKPAEEALLVAKGTYAEDAAIGTAKRKLLNLLQVKAAIASGQAMISAMQNLTRQRS